MIGNMTYTELSKNENWFIKLPITASCECSSNFSTKELYTSNEFGLVVKFCVKVLSCSSLTV